jgi:DNA-binding NarL/FixJ family response regulator
MSDPIRVLIVEDQRLMGEVLALMLGREDDIRVVGLATSVADAIRHAREQRPDVVLMDYHLPDGKGTEAAQVIHQDLPRVAVVMLTAESEEAALGAAVEAGACGFLAKSQAAQEVTTAVRRAAAGELLIPAGTLTRLLRGRGTRQNAPRRYEGAALTAREQQVLRLMARGLDSRDMAQQLGIGCTTVRSHVEGVLGKLHAQSRLQAVARARQSGLV